MPAIDCFFSGTGDMFSALTVVRLREAITASGLSEIKSWASPDDVKAVDLPLAKAVEKVLGSMHAILQKTKIARDENLAKMEGETGILDTETDREKRLRLRRTKAAEVRVVRNLGDLKAPKVVAKAEEFEAVDSHADREM